jgi:hypothetical protein
MKELLETRIQQRIEMLYRYTNAMERGDTDIIAVVLEEAQHDSVLERMILEVNEVYQIEDRTVAHPDDVVTAQEMLLTAFAEHTADGTDAPSSPNIVEHGDVETEQNHLVGTGQAQGIGSAQGTIPTVPVREMVAHADRKTHNIPPTRLRTGASSVPTFHPGKMVFPGKWYRSRASWLTGAVAAILIALLLLPGTGALADQFLSLFRVQQFQPVPTVERPDQLLDDVAHLLRNFGTVQWENGNNSHPVISQTASNNVADVEKLIDFHPQLPTTLPNGVGHVAQFSVSSSEDVTFVFDRAKTESYLQQTGQSNIAIPASLTGAKFNVHLSNGLAVIYYDHCQAPAQDGTQNCTSGNVNLALGEIPSPVINAEGNASFSDLRAFLLSLPKISPDLHSLIEHTDVNSGVVPVPVPSEMNAQQVNVKGVQGLLLSYGKAGLVMWQDHGLVYLVTAYGTDGDQLLNTANSLT